MCLKYWDSSPMSSAKSKSSSVLAKVHCKPLGWSIVWLSTQSTTSEKIIGENKQPCLTPVVTVKGDDRVMNHLAGHTIIQAVYYTHNLQGDPIVSHYPILHMVLLSTMSKAFLKSMKLMYTGDCHSNDWFSSHVAWYDVLICSHLVSIECSSWSVNVWNLFFRAMENSWLWSGVKTLCPLLYGYWCLR